MLYHVVDKSLLSDRPSKDCINEVVVDIEVLPWLLWSSCCFKGMWF